MVIKNRLYLIFFIVFVCLGFTSSGWGELITKGEGRKKIIVRDQFSEKVRKQYDIFAKKCTQCHSMSRPTSALINGKTPVTGSRFEKRDIKKYVIKMMRKPNSGISKSEAKSILRFLITARIKAKN